MTAAKIVESIRETFTSATSKAKMVGAHSQDVAKVGARTLRAAKDVVTQCGRDTAQVLSRSREELKRTLIEGAAEVGERLSRIATPTRKEEALARKLEVKAKKKRSREAMHREAGQMDGAAPAPG